VQFSNSIENSTRLDGTIESFTDKDSKQMSYKYRIKETGYFNYILKSSGANSIKILVQNIF